MLARKNLRLRIATIGLAALSAFVLMASGCGSKTTSGAAAQGNVPPNVVSTGPQSASAVPPKERPFVPPASFSNGSQFVAGAGGRMPNQGGSP